MSTYGKFCKLIFGLVNNRVSSQEKCTQEQLCVSVPNVFRLHYKCMCSASCSLGQQMCKFCCIIMKVGCGRRKRGKCSSH